MSPQYPSIRLFGISNCDTVKKACNWLKTNKVNYEFVDFRKDGFSKQQAEEWIDKIGIDTLLNKRSTTWKNLEAGAKENLGVEQALELILEHPTLIKRPLMELGGDKYIVGFKDTAYEQLFS